MGLIGWIIVGLVAGFVSQKVTNVRHGLLTNLLVGLVGAFVGGSIANRFDIQFVNNTLLDTTIIATLGAILVLFIYQKVRG